MYLQSTLDWLVRQDKQLFSFIQRHICANWLDGFMLLLRNPLTWVPLYIFLLYWVINKGKSAAIKFILVSVICFAITDYSCAHFLKPLFERIRPCYDLDMAGITRGIVNCGGKYSFPSNHAANHFGLASFWFFAVHQIIQKKWYWLWIWASLISFAQVYVGVHFPIDVLGGAFLGIFTGFLLSKVFEAWIKSSSFRSNEASSLSLH
jgi:undecaprenyl-diphosphatase